jgi:hypothetical protein
MHASTIAVARRIRFLGIVLLGFATPSVVHAVCSGSPPRFTQYYSELVSAGNGTPQSIVGSFWALGFGNPGLNAGIDNGAFTDEDGWLQPYPTALHILGDWSQSNAIDGCINGKIAPGKSSEIMVAEFSDRLDFSSSLFAVAAVARNAFTFSQFDFDAGIGRDITLATVPKPTIVSSARSGTHSVQIVVRGPTASELTSGFYSDGSVSLDEVIAGYRVYDQPWIVGTPIPDVRREVGWTPVTGIVPIGELSTVTLDCNVFRQYLAVSLVFDSGFETPYVSQKSTEIQCEICDGGGDGDGDGWWAGIPECGLSDCDDADPHTYPHAIEFNDGKDNQCPGDPGFGIVDEVDGTLGFATPGDKTALSWPAQGGAAAYEVARSSDPTLMADCTTFPTATPSIADAASPPAQSAFYYIVRSTAPHTGSWGRTSAGTERSTVCP